MLFFFLPGPPMLQIHEGWKYNDINKMRNNLEKKTISLTSRLLPSFQYIKIAYNPYFTPRLSEILFIHNIFQH